MGGISTVKYQKLQQPSEGQMANHTLNKYGQQGPAQEWSI